MESGELTVGEFLEYLAPAIWKDCPCWPGDLFALSAALLEKSSAYVELGMGVRPWRIGENCRNSPRRDLPFPLPSRAVRQ